MVFIDDATGKLMNLRFSETESAFDYMVATREYLEQHGKPTAFYSDRHAVFHVSKRDAKTERLTQFGRVLHDLNIELICANSSQAKGRVERANKTLQDRLVKCDYKESILSSKQMCGSPTLSLILTVALLNLRNIPKICIGQCGK